MDLMIAGPMTVGVALSLRTKNSPEGRTLTKSSRGFTAWHMLAKLRLQLSGKPSGHMR